MRGVTQTELMRGVRLTCDNQLKFKTGLLSVTLLTELDPKTAPLNAVLPFVLRRGTMPHPDMVSLALALDDLYGAEIEPFVQSRGDVQCLGFTAEFPDDAFVSAGGVILEKVAKLLGELLLSPCTSGGRLRADFVEAERRNLMDDLRAEINDKSAYALRKLTERMFEGDRYGVNCLGTLREASKISVPTLTRHYRELLARSAVEVFYCGAEEPERVRGLMREALAALPRSGPCERPTTEPCRDLHRERPLWIQERHEVAQGKLAVGYRLPGVLEAPDYPAMMVFDALFGATASSRLFREVRERRGLCYGVESDLDRHKGVLTVEAGIEPESLDETLGEIENQLRSLRDGPIETWELEAARRSVMHGLRALSDDPEALESFYLDGALMDLPHTPEELAALVTLVEAEDVRRVARSAVLDAVCFLTGEEADGAEA